MPRVLVVDDEEGYRAGLKLALSQAGHEIRTAATADEAIAIGACYRPDVLVTDWMLRDHVHGLHVAEALQTLRPDLQTILVTGFASGDLRSDAARARVFDFVEKPFTTDRVQTAVCEAVREGHADATGRVAVGVIQADTAGRIAYANPRATELLAAVDARAGIASLHDLFAPAMLERLRGAETRWVEVLPRGRSASGWYVRSRVWPDLGACLYVLIPQDEEDLKTHPVVRSLLGLASHPRPGWPLDAHVLLVDRSAIVRVSLKASLEDAGCLCHAAGEIDTALRLFQRDDEIGVVVLDCANPSEETERFLRKIKSDRPTCIRVGTASAGFQAGPVAGHLDHFLQKPFTVDDLVTVLTNRIGACTDCGLPLPLRRPRPGEVASSWACCGCGSRYFAVFDDRLSHDILANAHPAEHVNPRVTPSD